MYGNHTTFRVQQAATAGSTLAWSEKRKSPRLEKRFDTTIERAAMILPKGLNRAVPALAIDVSRDGLGLVTLEPFERESMARVLVDVGEAGAGLGLKKFSATVVVRHCRPVRNRGYKIGLLIKKEGTGREVETWHALIQRLTGRLL